MKKKIQFDLNFAVIKNTTYFKLSYFNGYLHIFPVTKCIISSTNLPIFHFRPLNLAIFVRLPGRLMSFLL